MARRICHLTTVHRQEDVRIFHKECVSLANAGYEVYLVSCGETYDKMGVHILGAAKRTGSRLKRMTRSAKAVYKAALGLDADVYHIHDPELIPYGVKLKRHGKKVIFDDHEGLSAQMLEKDWIPTLLRKPASRIYGAAESHALKKFDAVVTATPYLAEEIKGRCRRVAAVNNYPRLDDVEFHEKPFHERGPIVCYAGGIKEVRGEKIMTEAMKDVDGTLVIAGDHEIMEIGDKVRYTGHLDRAGVNDLYGSAVAGLCILMPTKHFYNSQPVKMYEYMAAGLPFVCSDFSGWRKVAEESRCGICVDPTDPAAVAKAINTLLCDRELAQEMGRSGYDYVISNCNWANEEKVLLDLYRQVLESAEDQEM